VSIDQRNAAWRILTHGRGGYSRGCRCKVCTDGKSAYMRGKRAAAAQRREQVQAAGRTYVAAGVYHGTSASYTDAGCRCERCREAKKQSFERTFQRLARRVAGAS
jgi:hypothetical protein